MNAMASGTPLAAGEAPAWASVHAEDYVNFRRRLPANQQPDLVSLFHPGVLSTAATQREYLILLHQLLSSSSSSGGGGRAYHESNAVPPPPRGLLATAGCLASHTQPGGDFQPLPLPAAVHRVPVLFTEFDPYDLRNLEGFIHRNVLPHVAGPKPAVLARGDNPFTSLCTRQVPCSVNEVTQNNGQWLLFGNISIDACAAGGVSY